METCVDPRASSLDCLTVRCRVTPRTDHFLVNVDKIPAKGAYFLSAAVKDYDCHDEPGRAIVLY